MRFVLKKTLFNLNSSAPGLFKLRHGEREHPIIEQRSGSKSRSRFRFLAGRSAIITPAAVELITINDCFVPVTRRIALLALDIPDDILFCPSE